MDDLRRELFLFLIFAVEQDLDSCVVILLLLIRVSLVFLFVLANDFVTHPQHTHLTH